jgi:hypothetical protein
LVDEAPSSPASTSVAPTRSVDSSKPDSVCTSLGVMLALASGSIGSAASASSGWMRSTESTYAPPRSSDVAPELVNTCRRPASSSST